MSNWSDLKNNPRIKKIQDNRFNILKWTREFFWSQNFIEAETPIAVRFPGQEPHLDLMSVSVSDESNNSHSFYLRTSPEFALKKLLASGYEKIFEIGKCFRNNESFGGVHNPEFTMIEWYRSPGNYFDIMDDAENLFKFISEKIGKEYVSYKNHSVNVFQKWERKKVKEIWFEKVGVNLDDYLENKKMSELADSLGFKADESEPFEDLFYKIFLNKIEPSLGKEKPIIIYDYPAQMCSLSRLCEQDKKYAERFEIYIAGLEVANAFGELLDPSEQKDRLEADKNARAHAGKETWDVDRDFIRAIGSGLRTAGGIALGVDRMVLLFTEAKDINEVIFQSVKNQLEI
jgi:lysyl-tRNA synthetase class 2